MIAALGPPPAEFLAKNPERRTDFWDDEGMLEPWTLDVLRLYVLVFPSLIAVTIGKWLGLAPIPGSRTMEARITRLEDPAGFLGFIRRALTWMPEERATAKELLKDPWLAEGEA